MNNSLPLIFCIFLITGCCHKPLCIPHSHKPQKVEIPPIEVRGAVYVDELY